MSKPLTPTQTLVLRAIQAVDAALARGDVYCWSNCEKCLGGHLYGGRGWTQEIDGTFDPITDPYNFLSREAAQACVRSVWEDDPKAWTRTRANLCKKYNLSIPLTVSAGRFGE